MDPNESMKYAVDAAKYICAGPVAYVFSIALFAVWTHSHSEKIESQEKLEQVVKEEADALGIDASNIVPVFEGPTTAIHKNDNDPRKCDLYLDRRFRYLSTRATVRHELAHYVNDAAVLAHYMNDADVLSWYNVKQSFRYLFKSEPRALLYGAWKIKVGFPKTIQENGIQHTLS